MVLDPIRLAMLVDESAARILRVARSLGLSVACFNFAYSSSELGFTCRDPCGAFEIQVFVEGPVEFCVEEVWDVDVYIDTRVKKVLAKCRRGELDSEYCRRLEKLYRQLQALIDYLDKISLSNEDYWKQLLADLALKVKQEELRKQGLSTLDSFLR